VVAPTRYGETEIKPAAALASAADARGAIVDRSIDRTGALRGRTAAA
jgi:hypothetical protein